MAPVSIPIRRLAELSVERLLRFMHHRRLIPAFVDEYARANSRQAVASSPSQRRNLIALISREALLLAALILEKALRDRAIVRPRESPRVATRQAKDLAEKSAPPLRSITLFRFALVDALAWDLKWKPEEAASFRHDLNLYESLLPRAPAKGRAQNRPLQPTTGPFVDRCALLLDPSFFQLARTTVAALQRTLEHEAQKTLRVTLQYLADR